MSEPSTTAVGEDLTSPSDLPPLPVPGKLPVENLTDALPLLRRPFAPAAVKWKPQATWPKDGPAEGAIFVGYIDARLVSARLNHVVGGNWSEKPVRVEGQPWALMYELTVFDQTHVDIGVAQGRGDDMKLKAMHSDGLKRPAVRFGIGEYLYAMPEVRIAVTPDGAETPEGVPTIKRRKDGKVPGFLPERIYAYLRERYEDWLKAEGEAAFGKPLDHGDASTGSVGEGITPDDADADQAVVPAPLEDERSKELGEQARKLRDEIREVDEGALPQQSFDAAMGQREHSHERLEDFVGNLKELLVDVKRFAELESELANALDDEAEWKKTVATAQRRASRRERVEVLEKALGEATKEEGGQDGEDA
jgi:hypothetical protein